MLNIFALAVICALAIGQSANGQFPDSYWVIAAVSLLASLPIVVAFGITLSHKQADGRHKVISTSRWFDFHMLSWCLSALSIIFVAKWPDWVHGRVFVEDWFLVDQIVILAPLWISWFASWTILFGLFRSEQTDTLGTHQTVRFESIRFAIKQSRLTLFLAWAPVLNFSTLHDLIRPWTDVIGESTVPIIVLVVNGLLLMTIFPRMLATLWDAQPMPAGPLRSRLEEAAVASRFALAGYSHLADTTPNLQCGGGRRLARDETYFHFGRFVNPVFRRGDRSGIHSRAGASCPSAPVVPIRVIAGSGQLDVGPVSIRSSPGPAGVR